MKTVLLFSVYFLTVVHGRKYGYCELAGLLRHRGIPYHQVPTWVCIAANESGLESRAVGSQNHDWSKDWGIFQISDKWWCSRDSYGKGCWAYCNHFIDDNINDDMNCAVHIFNKHQIQTGNGFSAWAVYNSHCRGNNWGYVHGCSF